MWNDTNEYKQFQFQWNDESISLKIKKRKKKEIYFNNEIQILAQVSSRTFSVLWILNVCKWTNTAIAIANMIKEFETPFYYSMTHCGANCQEHNTVWDIFITIAIFSTLKTKRKYILCLLCCCYCCSFHVLHSYREMLIAFLLVFQSNFTIIRDNENEKSTKYIYMQAASHNHMCYMMQQTAFLKYKKKKSIVLKWNPIELIKCICMCFACFLISLFDFCFLHSIYNEISIRYGYYVNCEQCCCC